LFFVSSDYNKKKIAFLFIRWKSFIGNFIKCIYVGNQILVFELRPATLQVALQQKCINRMVVVVVSLPVPYPIFVRIYSGTCMLVPTVICRIDTPMETPILHTIWAARYRPEVLARIYILSYLPCVIKKNAPANCWCVILSGPFFPKRL
jgi:hypothetical protein